MPRRCAFAREQDMYSGEIHQLYFGFWEEEQLTGSFSRLRLKPFLCWQHWISDKETFNKPENEKKDLQQLL